MRRTSLPPGLSLAPVLLLLLFLLSGTAGLAQEPPVLTLDEALERAREHNPDYRMARNDLELSETGRKEAWGAFLPSLDVSAGTGLSFNRQLVSVDNFGNPIENPFTEWRTSSSSSQSIRAGLTLFQGGQRFSQLSATAARARAREATVSGRLQTLRGEVVRTYYRALNQQTLLTVEREMLEGRRVDLEMTQRMFDLAGATRVEVLAAELNLRRQEQRIQQVQAQLDQALLTLGRIIGDPALDTFALDERLPEPFDPSGLEGDALVARAVASSPGVVEQEAQVEASRAQLESAKGSRWPSVSMSFGFNQRTFAQDKGALFNPFPDQGRYGSTSLSLSIPLFSRFQTQARIAEAEIARTNARETLRKIRLQAEENVRSRLIALRTAYQGWEIAVQSRAIAQERLELAREQYRLGSRTFTELQRDIEDAAAAEREVLNQLFGFLEARVNLEEAVGGEVR